MAQQTAIKPYNTFVKGIVTEAGPLTFPENASLDEENCVLNRDGSRQRRLGMDFEQDFVLTPTTLTAAQAVTSHRWKNAANDTGKQFVVVQVGQRLYIYNADTNSTSGNLVATLDATPFINGVDPINSTNGLGLFIASCKGSDPFYLAYNSTTGAVTIASIILQIRDVFGVDDGLAVDARPGTLSPEHDYNLHNQGWPSGIIGAYHTGASVYPSNAQQWVLGKDADDNFQYALLDKQDFGTSPAPKGRYIISPFERSVTRGTASGIGTTADTDFTRPSCAAFAFQRAFYAGMQSSSPLPMSTSPNLTGFVFYSRTVRSLNDLGRCYSEADPTSEVDSELVDTDGGFVIIPDSGKIHRLIPKADSIVVLAENGIWAIRGDDGGFRATVQQVVKLSQFGVVGARAVVDAEDVVFYWSRGGIYLIAFQDGVPSVQNITENSIQTFFNGLGNAAKETAVGSFDPTNRQVRWMYNDDPDYDGVSFQSKYTHELVLDLVLTAYYKNSISSLNDPSPYIAGYVEMPDPLLFLEGVRTRGTTVTKYLTIQYIDPDAGTAAVTFSYYRDGGFRDWRSLDGIGTSFSSYMITGYEIAGDTMRSKQAQYISCHFKMTERNAIATDTGVSADNPSGCFVQAQWDWSNHPDSGKWGEAFQAYRLLRPFILPAAGEPINYGYEVVTTKSRLPGSGKALSLLFQSDGDKDFYLYGWSLKISGETSV